MFEFLLEAVVLFLCRYNFSDLCSGCYAGFVSSIYSLNPLAQLYSLSAFRLLKMLLMPLQVFNQPVRGLASRKVLHKLWTKLALQFGPLTYDFYLAQRQIICYEYCFHLQFGNLSLSLNEWWNFICIYFRHESLMSCGFLDSSIKLKLNRNGYGAVYST